jgi:non-heme chloroperoxidase
MPIIEVNGAGLEYSELGAGEPLVFVHGSLEDLRTWRLQMASFAQHYHVVAYSRRYHFPNTRFGNRPSYSAGLHAEDLAGLLERLDLAPAHLACSSFGGYVALCLAARRPALVRSLVLAEPPLMPWLSNIPGGQPLADAFYADGWLPAQDAFRRGDPEAGVRSFLNAVMGREAFAHLSPSTRRALLDNAPAMQMESESADYFTPFTCDDAAAIDQPALLLEGELSPALFHLILDELDC